MHDEKSDRLLNKESAPCGVQATEPRTKEIGDHGVHDCQNSRQRETPHKPIQGFILTRRKLRGCESFE